MTCRWCALLGCLLVSFPASARTPADHFEKKVRPLLLAKCVGCHGPEKSRGGLRLDAAGIAKGGDSGPVLLAGKPDESRLIQAVRQQGDLKMPPSGRLKDQEIADLVAWVKAGAVWPGKSAFVTMKPAQAARTLEPNAVGLHKHLQAWYRADRLLLADGKPVHVWPDSSGKGRDLTATVGVRRGGVGQPGRFAKASTVNRRPAVRFDPETGLASSPDLPVQGTEDAGFTLLLMMNLQPTRWNRPLLLSIVKKPGPMRSSTRYFLDGVASEDSPLGRTVPGIEGILDIRHREDIGLSLGKALASCGSIRGDVSEVIVYNTALSDDDRNAVEMSLAERYAILHPLALAPSKVSFPPQQKAYWAFQPVKAVTPPPVRDEGWVKSPVDRFILARLEAAGLTPAPQADKRTLVRRVAFDLTGLPPTTAQVDEFLEDDRPEAFAHLVDRLLASPAYGERWGRHWLDVARYAESTANDANAVMRYAWRYRDYVVRSFNADKPYDRFVIEQIAGDLLPPSGDLNRDAEAVIATGFLMVGPKALAETDKEQSRRDIIDDQIDTTGRAFLGLTIGCARCHDHKFDPIPAVDYYSLAGIFRGTEVFLDENRNATMWQEWPLPRSPGEAPVTVMAPKESQPTNLRVALRGNYQSTGVLAPRRFLQILAGEGHAPITTAQSGRLELARWIAAKENPLAARVMVNRIWQHHFGVGLVATSDNFGVRGEKPSHPELLDWLAAEFVGNGWSVKHLHRLILLSSAYQTSTKTDALASKADPNNRLLGRTNRRRLDAESVRDAMLAVSGRLDRTVGGSDSGELLFKEAENIGVRIRPNRVQTDHPVYTNSTRRSLYLPVVRNAVPDVIALFDGADPNGVTAVRNDTTVASQALFLLNHPFVREQSLHFAKLLLADPKETDANRVTRAYRLALGREPSVAELREVADFLAAYQKQAISGGQKHEEARLNAWRGFCQTLFCRNEFLYLD